MVHYSCSSCIKTVAIMLVAIATRSSPIRSAAAASFVGTCSRGSTLTKSFFPSSRQQPQLSSTVRFDSGSRRRRTREANRKAQAETPQTLDWETFEFSKVYLPYGSCSTQTYLALFGSPKFDKRFDEKTNGDGQFVSDDELEDWREEEAKEDREAARQLNAHHQALQSLDPALVERASEVLVRHINEDRIERVESVLKQRTKQSRFLFENPTNPSNVWACLRTIDSFGIQNVDVVMEGDSYRGKAAIVQKRGMRTAMGSAQWLTLINHPDTASAVASIRKQQGFKIYASDLNPNSKDVRELDWVNAGPICVVMGNENNGISDEMRELADETFTLPMS
eukprot:scaffold53577_cov53-Attheya_sp.AAC.2